MYKTATKQPVPQFQFASLILSISGVQHSTYWLTVESSNKRRGGEDASSFDARKRSSGSRDFFLELVS